MSIYPREYPVPNQGYFDEKDYNAIVRALRGFAPEGTFVSPYSYLISTDGEYYYASNGFQTVYGGPNKAGGVDGTDAAAVIQAAIGNLTSGGKLLIKRGEYNLDSPLTIPYPITIEGEGQAVTVLKSSVTTGTAIQFKRADGLPLSGVGLRDLDIYCTGNPDYALGLFYIPNSRFNGIRNLFISGTAEGKPKVGIHIEGCWDISIENSLISASVGGILVEQGAASYTSDSLTFNGLRFNLGGTNAEYAIKQILGITPKFISCTIEGTIETTYGIWLLGVKTGSAIGTYFEDCLNGFRLDASGATPTEFFMAESGWFNRVTYPVYLGNADRNQFFSFAIAGAFTETVYISSDAWGNCFFDACDPTSVDGTGKAIFFTRGTGGKLKIDTMGLGMECDTKNSGTATIDDSKYVSFYHELAGTPTMVNVSFKTVGYGSWIWSATYDRIEITVENSGTYDLTWEAEYKP